MSTSSNSNAASDHKLSNPADILRWLQLNFLVNSLKGTGVIRSDKAIHEATGHNQGNISSYLSGYKPISDNFWKDFLDSYKKDLESILTSEKYLAIKVDEDFVVKDAQAITDVLESIEKRLSTQEQNTYTIGQDMGFLKEALLDMTRAINALTMEIKKNRKKTQLPKTAKDPKQKK